MVLPGTDGQAHLGEGWQLPESVLAGFISANVVPDP